MRAAERRHGIKITEFEKSSAEGNPSEFDQ